MKIEQISFADGVDDARKSLAKINLSQARAEVDAIEAERLEVSAGIDRAKAEMASIGRRLAEARSGVITDPEEHAEALLRGDPVAVEGVADLELQRRAIEAGHAHLRNEEARLSLDLAQAKGRMSAPLIAAVEPMVGYLSNNAAAAAEALADVYSGLRAIAAATGSAHAASLADSLIEPVALLADMRLLDRTRRPVPDYVESALEAGQPAITQAGRSIPGFTVLPDSRPNPALAVLIGQIGAAARRSA